MKVRLRAERTINRNASHHPDVEAHLGDVAFGILERARAKLEEHRKTGAHKVTQTKGKVDHYVNLEGPSAPAIEDGHFAPNGRWVPGLRILRDSM